VVGDPGRCKFLPQSKAILLDKFAGGCVTAERNESVREKADLFSHTVIC